MSAIENVVATEIAKAISRHLADVPAGGQVSAPAVCNTGLAGRISYTLLKADATEEQIAEAESKMKSIVLEEDKKKKVSEKISSGFHSIKDMARLINCIKIKIKEEDLSHSSLIYG